MVSPLLSVEAVCKLHPQHRNDCAMMLMQLVEELLPEVEDAPILGGHNRQPRAASLAPPALPPPSAPLPPLGGTHGPGAALMRVSSSGSHAFTDSTAFRMDPAHVSHSTNPLQASSN